MVTVWSSDLFMSVNEMVISVVWLVYLSQAFSQDVKSQGILKNDISRQPGEICQIRTLCDAALSLAL